ncbi:hypothetical protein J2W56_000792 [Nocardia kruczakiae]|uniref:Uncharacterized protein n=1 Tax=Nocardia kruczakiae TaxID=261477 RepID=A0ABU1X9W1_9NOCA|nr:hypothetical protein [Nocardia kruczakiae]
MEKHDRHDRDRSQALDIGPKSLPGLRWMVNPVCPPICQPAYGRVRHVQHCD